MPALAFSELEEATHALLGSLWVSQNTWHPNSTLFPFHGLVSLARSVVGQGQDKGALQLSSLAGRRLLMLTERK